MKVIRVRTQPIYELEFTEVEINDLSVALHNALTFRNSPSLATTPEVAEAFRALTERIATLCRDISALPAE